jgi:hypothetical protein
MGEVCNSPRPISSMFNLNLLYSTMNKKKRQQGAAALQSRLDFDHLGAFEAIFEYPLLVNQETRYVHIFYNLMIHSLEDYSLFDEKTKTPSQGCAAGAELKFLKFSFMEKSFTFCQRKILKKFFVLKN